MPQNKTTQRPRRTSGANHTVYPLSRSAGRGYSGGRTNAPRRKKGKRTNERAILLGAAALLCVLILFGTFSFLTRKNGTEIKLGEAVVGIVKGTDIKSEDLKNTVSAQLKEERGSAISINETITATPVHIGGKDTPLTLDAIVTELKKKVTYKVEAAVIMADGAPIAILNNTEEANSLLDSIRNEYIPEDKKESMTAEFTQDVKVVNQFVESEEIITVDMAKDKFVAGTTSQKPYTIQTGDTLSRIAANSDMTIEEILAVNPGMTISTNLVIGKQINITITTPFLSVKTIETVTYTEREPKTVTEQEDNTKPSGYRKVVQQGQDGQSKVTSQIIRINGFEEERKEISREIIEAPVEEIIIRGTK